MATATTSRPVSLPIQLIATEVSRPPEYARMTRSDMYQSPYDVLLLEVLDGARKFGAGHGLTRHHQDGVVACDGADDKRQRGAINCARQVVGRSGWGTQHRQVAAGVGGHQQVAQQPRHPFGAA